MNQRATTRKSLPPVKEAPSVTSVVCVDENNFVSASSNSKSGIRMWDLRYQKTSKEVRNFKVPESTKLTGVASLSCDRFHSTLFAASTDGFVYAYALRANYNAAVRQLQGGTTNSFYVKCAASPFSDHLLCGTSLEYALIWDLQESMCYKQDVWSRFIEKPQKYLPLPKFKLEGHHKGPVDVACWSHTGRYIATLAGSMLRIWDGSFENNIWSNNQTGEKPERPTLLELSSASQDILL